MLPSLQQLSKLGIFYVNDIIINDIDRENNISKHVLTYNQSLERASMKSRKGKHPKVFSIIRECALDCLYFSQQPNHTIITNNNEDTPITAPIKSIVSSTINNLPSLLKIQHTVSLKKNKKEFVYTEKIGKYNTVE